MFQKCNLLIPQILDYFQGGLDVHTTPPLPDLSSWVWGEVKDKQQNDVMFVGIKMVAMVGKSSMKNETLGRLSPRQVDQSQRLMPTVVVAL